MRYLWLADVPQESQVNHSSDSIFSSAATFFSIRLDSFQLDRYQQPLLAPLVLGQEFCPDCPCLLWFSRVLVPWWIHLSLFEIHL